ncbi:Kcnh5 [Symbiodinium natans]|uniref:Kcnh5 protein n=1 Tax=Symbiodinium natans TaxID=878477 RepID=A0A812JVP7_9DINO|nr:Kcnh5 [Symbiodinium natans]
MQLLDEASDALRQEQQRSKRFVQRQDSASLMPPTPTSRPPKMETGEDLLLKKLPGSVEAAEGPEAVGAVSAKSSFRSAHFQGVLPCEEPPAPASRRHSLMSNAEVDLKLAQSWRRKGTATTSKVARTATSGGGLKQLSGEDDAEQLLIIRTLNRFVLDPSSPKRLGFEVLGLFLIIYDLFWLPMQVFDPPGNTFTEVMGWTSSIYWALDIPMSFLVGQIIQKKGIIEMHVRAIAGLYIRGWFWFDILVVSVDWSLNVYEMVTNTRNVGGISALRLGKGVRILRVFRLIRVLKGGGMLQELLDTIHSEHCIIIVGIVKLLGLILCVNHFIACLWFWIGRQDPNGIDTWFYDNAIDGRGIPYQYSTCLHWSLTQFTPASMEVYPTNATERIFCVCVIVSAMVIFSSFISAITNAMTQLRTLNKDRNEQFSLLRRYLTQCNVSGGLLARVLQSVSSAMNRNKRRVHEEDIKVLNMLPLSLRQDLNSEVYSPTFALHPFFSVCNSCFELHIRKLYSVALKGRSLPPNQELITSGESATAMYFITSGALTYKCDKQLSPLPVLLQEGKWICEAALWLKWSHNGFATTGPEECDVVGLDAGKFQDIFKDDITVKNYAVAFWTYFMECPGSLTDAWADEELLFDWATGALVSAEKHVGGVINPDHRNHAFTRHVINKRRSSSAMLDETHVGKIFPKSGSSIDGPE